MAWEEGINEIKLVEDINEKFLKLEGELTDEEAGATLAEFLFANPGFALDILGGIKLFPLQEIIIKGWMRNDYSMAVWGRGLSKSFSAAIFCLLWALFNPGNRIVLISFAFRASRRILEQIEKFVNSKNATLLKNCFPKELSKKADEYQWKLPNGASILSLPLGDGTKIRGIRADTLVIDEYNYINESIITEVIQPFLVSNSNVTEQLTIDEYENDLIKKGQMKEEDRTKLAENIKVIALSSAGFQFEDMYKKYNNWVENIMVKKKEGAQTNYFVSRLSYEAAPEGLVNAKVMEEAKQGTSESVFNREYRGIFTPDSDGYFSAKKMLDCTIPNGSLPSLELTGEPNSEYILSIDPSFSSAEYSDFFAMVLLKIVKKGDKFIPMVVHTYAVAGGDLKDHTAYLFYFLKHFNIVYIAIDSSNGDSNEFMNSSNQSKLFKDHKIELLDIEADFSKDDMTELPKQIRKSYNKGMRRIIQKQTFGGNFQRVANEYLQGCFDYKNIFFASKLASQINPLYMDADISIITSQPYYKDMSINDFIEHQDYLIDLMKQQCALIELSSTGLGTMSWDLPLSFRRSRNPDRMRKDLYSALLLGNWAFKLYQMSLTLPQDEDFPQHFSFLA